MRKGDSAVIKEIIEMKDYLEVVKSELDKKKQELNDLVVGKSKQIDEELNESITDIQDSINDINEDITSIETSLSSKIDDIATTLLASIDVKTSNAVSLLEKDITQRIELLKSLIPIVPDTKESMDMLSDRINKLDNLLQEVKNNGLTIDNVVLYLQNNKVLQIDDIIDLREELDKLKKSKSVFGGIMGGSPRNDFIDDETPTGEINGVSTVFTLNLTPNPTSLKVYRGGARQKVGEDYTFSSKTITFTIPPVVGEIITCDYRI